MIRAFIVETPFGIFGLDQEIKIISKQLFNKEASVATEKLVNLQRGDVIPEIEAVIEDLIQKQYDELILENMQLARNLKDKPVSVEFPSEVGRVFRSKLIPFIREFGIWKSEEEIFQHVQRINILITRQKIKAISEEKDRFIAQAIEAVDDCDKSLNIFASRIREWYGLHFPELDKKLPSHTSFIKIVGKVGQRDQILTESFENAVGFPVEKIEMIKKMARGSMGASITDFEFEPLRKFALITEQLYGTRDLLATYIDEAMQEVAPNLRALVGSLLGARLISRSGNLKRLARFPASTIQVLGAEKALFRSLRTGAKPPKHGIIFQWEEIHGAPYWLKGKIARLLAGKLSLAARIDYFSGEYYGDNLLEDLNKHITNIKKKYPSPPKKPKKEKPVKAEKKSSERDKKKYWKKRKKFKKKKPDQ